MVVPLQEITSRPLPELVNKGKVSVYILQVHVWLSARRRSEQEHEELPNREGNIDRLVRTSKR